MKIHHISFSVEEYKRPKFYTEFEKVKGSYRVNDTIKLPDLQKPMREIILMVRR